MLYTSCISFRILLILLPVFSTGSPPVITEHPVGATVARGVPATLYCEARGDPEPFITWYKNGEQLELKELSDHYVLLPGGSLFFLRTVENAKTRDSGEYHCQAENRDGSVKSRPAKLSVTYLRNKFGDVARHIEVTEGDILRIACKPPEGNPSPRVSWEKDGQPLVADDFFIVEENGDLLIAEAGVEDTGAYTCVASSAGAARRDQNVKVIVTRRAAVVIDQPLVPGVPEIAEASMLDAVTGLVQWLPLAHVAGYTVLLTANSEQVTNITVEHDVTQIKLHSLDPSLAYSVQVAGIYGDGKLRQLGAYSQPARQLSYKTHEVVLVNSTAGAATDEEIPIKIWAIAMAIVIIVTLTIVMAAALLCYKTNKFRSSRHSQGGCSSASGEYGVVGSGGGGFLPWADPHHPHTHHNSSSHQQHHNSHRSWDDNSPTTSFRSQNRLLLQNNNAAGLGYDYAVPPQHHRGQQQHHYSTGGSGGSGSSNHYASNTILKASYYEPLNMNNSGDTSNSSFESDYKTPHETGGQQYR